MSEESAPEAPGGAKKEGKAFALGEPTLEDLVSIMSSIQQQRSSTASDDTAKPP
jgi:hypothetical protein